MAGDTAKIGPATNRTRLLSALAGEPVDRPVYAAYDWYVKNEPLDWEAMFALGLGQINHADVVAVTRPNVEIHERSWIEDGRIHREVRWVTDIGELQQSWVDRWRTSHLLKEPNDFRIMRRALEGEYYTPVTKPFDESEAKLGDRGVTLGHLGWEPLRRTPVMDLQAEWAGIESVAINLADELPELMELLEVMDELMLAKCRAAAQGPARFVKLWENLSIETVGLTQFRRRVLPLYRKMTHILEPTGKRLLVHADGKLRPIKGDLTALAVDIDSFTEPPEGDMSTAEARAAWPEKFLWLTPSQSWFDRGPAALANEIQRVVREAGPRQFCLMISEGVPPGREMAIAAVLEALSASATAN